MPHPATGRPLIYANASYISRITGLEHEESRAVLDRIYGLINRPDFQVRIKWRPGTVAVWGNFRPSVMRSGIIVPRIGR